MLASKQPCPQTSSTANTAISNKSTLAQLIKNNAPLIATVAPLMTMANLSMMYTVLSGKLLASQPKHNNAPLMDSKFAVSGYCWMHKYQLRSKHSSATSSEKANRHKICTT